MLEQGGDVGVLAADAGDAVVCEAGHDAERGCFALVQACGEDEGGLLHCVRDGCVVLVAVGAAGARAKIRSWMEQQKQKEEG